MTDGEKRALLARTSKAAQSESYEQYKTTTRFDRMTQHPRWLETAQFG